MSANATIEIRRAERKDCQIISLGGYMGNDEWAKLEDLLEKLFERRFDEAYAKPASEPPSNTCDPQSGLNKIEH